MITDPSEKDVFWEMTHPGFTVTCAHCDSNKVYFDSDLGFSFGVSAFWGGIYFVCLECEKKFELDIFYPPVHKVKYFSIKCDKCDSRITSIDSNVVFEQCRPPSSGSVYLKCHNCESEVEIWSTYMTNPKTSE